jgi:hypothetical protein
MLGYLRKLTPSRLVLWCYLVWYLAVVVQHFDATPSLWVNALGISAIMGTAYYLSACAGSNERRPDRWQVFRMYLMPFCVSSFAALIKGQGFVLVFHPTLAGNRLALGLIALLCAVVFAVRRFVPAALPGAPELAPAAPLRGTQAALATVGVRGQTSTSRPMLCSADGVPESSNVQSASDR